MTKIMGERLVHTVVGMVCDRCKTVYEDTMETQEFLSWNNNCGYGNYTYGDLNTIRVDLCQTCVQAVLGEWIRVEKPLTEEELTQALTNGERFKW